MRTVVDDRLRREATRYRLRFDCDACAHLDPEAGVCANGFPTEAHRGIRLERVDAMYFCKDFELA